MSTPFPYEQAFSRNIGWVTKEEQARLRQKRVAIAGGGGVGGVHAMTLARLGVEPIPVEGATFDPSLHEALTHEEAAGFGEGQVIREVTRGYRLGNRVLRCSLVRVAKGRPTAGK